MSGIAPIYHQRAHVKRINGIDARAVIYAAALGAAVDAGTIPEDMFCERVDTVVLGRPQLDAINGRPC